MPIYNLYLYIFISLEKGLVMSNDISSLSAYGKIQNSFLNNVKEKIELEIQEEVFDFSNIEQNI